MKKLHFWLSLIAIILFSFSVNAQQHTKTYRKVPLWELKDSIFRCTIFGKNVYLDGDIYLGDTTELNRYQNPVSYTHLRAHETVLELVCRLLLEKKKHTTINADE